MSATSEPLPYPPRRSFWLGPGQVPRPVIGVDIDGTLGEWHGHFLEFAANWLGRDVSRVYRGGPMYRHVGVSKDTYRKIKLAFRQGGLKRWMPVYEGASELTRKLRGRGAEVWVCTSRPFLRLDNLDPDTRHWLRRSGIQYDGVLFGERKYVELSATVGKGRIVGVVDDLPEMYDQAEERGLSPLLLSKPYNIGLGRDRVDSLDEALEVFMERVHQYEEKNRGS